MTEPIQRVLALLQGVRTTGPDRWQVICPAHADRTPSLSITKGRDGRILLHCHAGCSTEHILRQLGLEMTDLFPPKNQGQAHRQASPGRFIRAYDYKDARGRLAYQVCRYAPKTFRVRRPDGRDGWLWNLDGTARLLYRLPELLAADPARTVFIVEGEKDADAVRSLGLVATCNPGGAMKWRHLSADSALEGRRVIILADKDDSGRKHAEDVALRLFGKVKSLKILELPGKGVKDSFDWVEAGGTRKGLLELAKKAPAFEKPTDTPVLMTEEHTKAENDMAAGPRHTPGNAASLCSDLGNAARLVRRYGADLRYCGPLGRWLVWNGTCWQPDGAHAVMKNAKNTALAILDEAREAEDEEKRKGLAHWAVRSQSRDRLVAMTDLARCELAVLPDQLDSNRWLLNVLNGTLDLKTGRLRPHRREDLITIVAPVQYSPKAKCPRWKKFLREIMASDTEMISALQRLSGCCLTGDISAQVLPIFYGPGGNGKNVFLDTLLGILGPYAAEASEGLVTTRRSDEHPTEIADLCGKRLVVASEAEEGRKMRIGLVKKITGNRYLKARFMRQDYFQFERTHKTILVTNNKPVITETSNAIWRRLRLIPFTVTIPEEKQDAHLTEKLEAEWPGILAWAVCGCLEWQKRQCDLAFPDTVREATQAYREESDHVSDFLTERCILWPQHSATEGSTAKGKKRLCADREEHVHMAQRTPKEHVYLAYIEWCKANGEDTLPRSAFNKRLRDRDLFDKTARVLSGENEKGPQKCWMNLTLRRQNREP